MNPRDLALAARIAATIPYVWLRVRLLPLPKALAGLKGGSWFSVLDSRLKSKTAGSGPSASPLTLTFNREPPLSGTRAERALRIVRLTDLCLQRRVALLRPSCMLRSLVLFRFLREAGLPVRVHFGVAREEGSLKGHSWLTLDGLPFAEAGDPSTRFQIAYSFPPDDAPLAPLLQPSPFSE